MDEPDIITQGGEYGTRDGRKAIVVWLYVGIHYCAIGKIEAKPGGKIGGTYYWDRKGHYIAGNIGKLDIVSVWRQGDQMFYRMYLLGLANHIQAAETFLAKDDFEAQEIFTAVFGSCSTSFQGAELWRGAEMITRQVSEHVRATVELQRLIDKRPEGIVQFEEMLERSFECVRQSRQLMDALDKIRAG
jgi:hypothetical protein